MKRKPLFFSTLAILAITACLALGSSAFGASQVKKRFFVSQDRGRDILCDPYTVKKDDYLIRLFQQRGEIASRDLPMFLEIFKRINPEITDVNLIYPNQKILIPLKILTPGALDGQETGIVSIPMIIISNISDELMASSAEHIVVSGDTVSSLLLPRFGKPGTSSYQQGIEIFKYLNSEINDINKIHVGQKIRLPDPAVQDQTWYTELFDESGRIIVPEDTSRTEIAPLAIPEPRHIEELALIAPIETHDTAAAEEKPVIPAEPSSAKKVARTSPRTLFEKAARIFRANLIDSGEYFFPRKGQPDFRLDLSISPVMEFRSGKRVLYAPSDQISAIDADVIKIYWKNLVVLQIPATDELRDLLNPICPIIHGGECDSMMSFEDQGVQVTLRADYIYDNPNRHGKVYLAILDHPDRAMPAGFRAYLEGKGILVSEWINSDTWFGAADRYGVRQLLASDAVVLQPASPEGMVRQLADLLGFTYQEKLDIEFPYAGFQVKTRANLLTTRVGREVIVDFGNLRGEALTSLEAKGFSVLQIDRRQSNRGILQKLLDHLAIAHEKDPTFWVADRPRINNPSMQVPGLMATFGDDGGQRILFSDAPVPLRLVSFFMDAGIRVVSLSP